MPYYLLNSRLEIISESLENDFSIQGYICVKADTPELLPKPIEKSSLELLSKKTVSGDWNFDLFTETQKKKLLTYYKQQKFDLIKDMLNKAEVTVLCCSAHKNLITAQIEQALRSGRLSMGLS